MMGLRTTKNTQGNMAIGKAGTSPWTVAWYALGALVLGALLAKWSWILLKSPSTVAALVPDHAVSENSGRLFGAATAESTAAAMPNVKLIGVFAPESGRSGFAVLKLDEQRQIGAAVGENVAPGVKLLEVHADHVVLERSGAQQRVDMINASATGTGIVPARQ
jgi:general secretion pathway protein C